MDDLFDMLMDVERTTAPERETYIRAPYGWPGGKWQSLKHIIPMLGRGRTLLDGCGGSGIITINAPPSYTLKVFNDRHAGVVAFYRCIRDPVKVQQLADRLELCVHSREEFLWARDSWGNVQDDVERAARWYYMLRMSFGQLGRNFGRSTTGPNMLANKFHKALQEFPAFHNVFKGCLIENLDVVQAMRDFDSRDTDHYIDPDYIGADPGIYEHRVEHRALLKAAFEMRGQVMISGYDNELYNEFNWDDKVQWDVTVPIASQAFNDDNGLTGKQNVMTRDRKAKETMWIKASK